MSLTRVIYWFTVIDFKKMLTASLTSGKIKVMRCNDMKDQKYYEKACRIFNVELSRMIDGRSHNYNRLRKLCDICIQGQKEGFL
jgi:hypothetical protein